MTKFMMALLAFLLAFMSTVKAEPYVTTEIILQGLLSMSASKCASRGELVKEYEAQGKSFEAELVKLAEKNLCECVPEEINKAQKSLSLMELKEGISEQEFSKKYRSKIFDVCVAKQFRSTYGSSCGVLFSKTKKNSEKYCSCMSKGIESISDSVIYQIGIESSRHIPIAAEAQRKGLSAPPQPPALERFTSMDISCSSK